MNSLTLIYFALTAILWITSVDSRDSMTSSQDKECAGIEEERVKGQETSKLSSEEKLDEKRKWGDSVMRAWGKREETDKRDWNRNSIRAWGKRDGEEGEDDKRLAGSKSSLRVWDKRDEDPEEEKRKWGDNKMRIWGKRDQEEFDEEGKRRWGTNGPLRAWGKRRLEGNTDLEIQSKEESKRDWNSRVRAWGKRDNSDEEKSSSEDSKVDIKATKSKSERVKRAIESRMKRSWDSDAIAFRNRLNYYPPEGPKRSWRTNVIRVWGKRRTQ